MKSKSLNSIGIAIITHNARNHLQFCLPPLLNSPLKPKILVVNSSSHDGTVELAREMGAETLVIPRKEFNHGHTREKARKLLNVDIVVMMTPDAYPIDQEMIGKLVEPLRQEKASISYARQIPHAGAGFFESFPREFNYPNNSHIRGLEDISKYGVYTIFCSNSCAAYLNHALDEIGGFKPVLLGEDTFAVAELLLKGHKVAYTAEAIVSHSHGYSLKQEFKRSFDTGLIRKQQSELIKLFGKDETRGREFVKQMMGTVLKKQPHMLPYACFQTLAKYVGYRLGTGCVNLPNSIKKLFSSQDFYWSSDFKE
jgi:rhamnosyltransferase